MLDSSSGWAVGGNGVILRASGGSWGKTSSPTSNTLRSVFMVGSSDGWAVGDGGTIIRYQNGLWVNYPSPTAAQLNSVSMLNSGYGWAVGAGGTILHYNGLNWTPVGSGISTNLNSVGQTSAQSALAVGDSATFVQWNGVAWYQAFPSPALSGSPNLNSVFVTSNGFGLIVGAPPSLGAQGTILQASIPIPEFSGSELLLGIALIATLGVVQIHRRKLR